MSTVTENDLKELKEDIKKLTETVNQIAMGQIELKTTIQGIDKRLENIEANNRVAIGALFGGIGLAILKLFFTRNI
jgi:septal ring factor EnvC (AmiA/AmiB activator)